MNQYKENFNLPDDLHYVRTAVVNVIGYGQPAHGPWTLIDTGVPGFTQTILDEVKSRFGARPPQAIVLTHGHFDHIGCLQSLLERWDVPVYAHLEELPYLQGKADYPPGDPTVGGGLMAGIAGLYPHVGIDLGERVRPLPTDSTVPGMEGWRWIHTPGHTPGHVSLFRESDRALIAGDAFITVKQESALAVMTQDLDIHGPPTYFTPDWDQARTSVQKLAALEPAYAITGHGRPVSGTLLQEGLSRLAADFDRLAIPEHGRYVHR